MKPYRYTILIALLWHSYAFGQPTFNDQITNGELIGDLNAQTEDILNVNDITGTVTQEFVPDGGATGNVLRKASGADYDTEWSGAGASGAWRLIETKTASGGSSVEFTTGIDSTYDEYVIIISAAELSVDNRTFDMRVSTDGGATWESGASDYAQNYQIISETVETEITAANHIRIANVVGNDTGESLSATVRIFRPSDTTVYTSVTVEGVYFNTAAETQSIEVGGSYNALTAVDGVQFFNAFGANIASGDFSLYGIARGSIPPTGPTELVGVSGLVAMSTPIVNGQSSVSVDLTAFALGAAPDWSQGVVENVTDATPFALYATVTDKDASQITFDLNGIADTGNYVLKSEWGANAGEHGTTAIGSGVSTIAIDLTAYALGAAPTWAQVTIENTADATPFALYAQVTAKTATTLTAEFNGTTDTANYSAKWQFIE